MTDEGQPMSRRQRRAMEQGADGPETSTETGSIPTLGPDGKPLSRRDRRRLERSERPMETWTAEEERIATGQIPAMTPEVIAEQERLAREKAEAAAAEARAASAELRRVASASQVSASTPVTPAQGTAPPPITPRATPESEPYDAPTPTPDAGRPSWMDDIAQSVSSEQQSAPSALSDPDAFMRPAAEQTMPASDSEQPQEPAAEPEQSWPQQPAQPPAIPGFPARASQEESSAPTPQSSAIPGFPPHASQESSAPPPDPTPDGDADAADQDQIDDIPEAFRHLFPPGSLQARRMREQAEAAREEGQTQGGSSGSASEAPDSLTTDAATGIPDSLSAEPREDPAEEIRRLTASAMAGIDRHHQEESAPEQDVDAAASNPYATGEQPLVAPDVSGEQPQWDQEAPSQTPSPFAGFAPREGDQDAPSDPTYGEASAPSPAPEPAQEPAEDDVSSFDALVGGADAGHSGATPAVPELDDRPGAEGAGQSQEWGQQHAPADTAATAAHPLTGAHSPSQEPPQFEPSHGATQPTSGQQPTVGQPGLFEAPPTTGSIEVPRREVPDLQPAGGAHHFRWAHLAVIGAIAFVLGVVVWNLAGPTL